MRLIALVLFRGVPILVLLLLLVFLFDVGGAQQPMVDAYIRGATWVGEWFGQRFADSLVPSPTPSPRPRS